MWLPPNGQVVYKVDCGSYNNENEHQNMVAWRAKGHTWAPPTFIYVMPATAILAMPYYARPLRSTDQLPASIHQERVDDLNPANFRLSDSDTIMLVDADYPSQGSSYRALELRQSARRPA